MPKFTITRSTSVTCLAVLVACISLAPALPAQQNAAPVAVATRDRPDGGTLRVGRIVKRRFETFGDSTVERGESVQELSRTTAGGRRVLISVQHFAVADGPAVDSSIADAKTLEPTRHVGVHPSHLMVLEFAGAKVTGRYDKKGAPHVAIDQETGAPSYDSSLFDLVLAALPLAPGYAAHLPFYIYEQGGAVWWDARVTGTEDLALRDGQTAPAWVVDVFEGQRHRMKLWISREGERDVLRATYDIGPGHSYTSTR